MGYHNVFIYSHSFWNGFCNRLQFNLWRLQDSSRFLECDYIKRCKRCLPYDDGVKLMSGILDDKVLISIKSSNGERRYFNRITQGFTARWNGLGFYDTTGRSLKPYFNSFRQHNQSESIWQAMRDNDSPLEYRKFTFSHLARGNLG